jgi:hypothetical protein
MLEISLLALVATLGATAMLKMRDQKRAFFAPLPHLKTITTIAQQGAYTWDKAQDTSTPQAFRNLHLIEGGLSLNGQNDTIDWLFSDIQAQSNVYFTPEGMACVQWHIARNGVWRVLTVQLLPAEMRDLMAIVRRYRPHIATFAPNESVLASAKLAHQDWAGELTLVADVWLLVLRKSLIVLQDDRVQAKIALASLRRVIALERRESNDGLLRLHSANETVLFALKRHTELAHILADRAHCTLEIVTDKKQKNPE